MFTMTNEERVAVERLCREVGVKQLDLFGSATSDAFDPERSDLDFLVEFLPGAKKPWMGEYADLQEGLEGIFERPVDLVFAGGLKNPFFRRAALASKRTVYDAANAQAHVRYP
jgi:predicted nucleotidyltransferase